MSHVWKKFLQKPISSLKTMKMHLLTSKLRACRKKKFDWMKIQKITSVNFQVGFPSWNCKNVISKAKVRLEASQVAEMMCCDQWNTLLNFGTPDKSHKLLYHPKKSENKSTNALAERWTQPMQKICCKSKQMLACKELPCVRCTLVATFGFQVLRSNIPTFGTIPGANKIIF